MKYKPNHDLCWCIQCGKYYTGAADNGGDFGVSIFVCEICRREIVAGDLRPKEIVLLLFTDRLMQDGYQGTRPDVGWETPEEVRWKGRRSGDDDEE